MLHRTIDPTLFPRERISNRDQTDGDVAPKLDGRGFPNWNARLLMQTRVLFATERQRGASQSRKAPGTGHLCNVPGTARPVTPPMFTGRDGPRNRSYFAPVRLSAAVDGPRNEGTDSRSRPSSGTTNPTGAPDTLSVAGVRHSACRPLPAAGSRHLPAPWKTADSRNKGESSFDHSPPTQESNNTGS